MATVDSGTETLFSDDSPCELNGSPSACSGDELESRDHRTDVSSRLAPPNIQPYSGVLEKGKVVIRPIAFKPTAMTPAARFGLAGERYGSTPILTRPGSRLTLYGSTTDLRQPNSVNYSLDRKLRSCQSTSSSPPLAMSSLTSLPHKLKNYDSLESVRKSPMSTTDSSSLINKSSYRLSGAPGGSLMDLTPSPSDSGVSELEAALRERDSELAYLRQTMEHNEQVIFRVYQEKEKVWERELRRLKSVYESRLRASTQKALKLDQVLMMLTNQYQQEKKRICTEAKKTSTENERLRQELDQMRHRLEETEWNLCQKTGELSLVKSQLKDCQNDQTAKSQELLQLRNECREIKEKLEEKESKISELSKETAEKAKEIEVLRQEIYRHPDPGLDHLERNYEEISETERLRAEIRELREELSDLSLSEYGNAEPGRVQRSRISNNQNELKENCTNDNLNHYCPTVEKLKKETEQKARDFEKERQIWAQEKEKVLKYQRQLQMHYVQMYRRTRALESEVESLTVELELDKNGVKKKISPDLTKKIHL